MRRGKADIINRFNSMEIIDVSLLILLGAILWYLVDEVFGLTVRIRLWLGEL